MIRRIVVGILACLLAFPVTVLCLAGRGKVQEEDLEKAEEYFDRVPASNKPRQKEGGGKYTIAYVDIDPYPASGEMLYNLIEELKKTGWISDSEPLPFDPADTDAGKLIRYLSGRDLGEYIQFSDEANYYIAVDDKAECMRSLEEQIHAGRIDLILCMGTSPGEMVIREMKVTEVPVMVYFSVDPVNAGLTESEEYSGQDNVWCHTSSEVYANQIQFYHKNCPFTNIGMVYYNESVAAMEAYRAAAEEIGFRISERKIKTLSDATSQEQVQAYYRGLSNVFSELIEKEKIDAFMLNTDIIKDDERIAGLLEAFYQNNIPVFVQNGEFNVGKGAFMVVTASDAKIQAPFAIDAMASILNGRKPGDIYQKFVPSPYLSINLEAAERIGYQVKEELLLSAEKLYGGTYDKDKKG